MRTFPVPTGFRSLPLPLAQLSLSAVLNCGQSFRWTSYPISETICEPSTVSPTYEYRFCLRDRVVCLRQSSEFLFYRTVFPDGLVDPTQVDTYEVETLLWLKDYFQLNVDLVELYNKWSERDPVFRNIQSRFSGIRMLRQDPWENLVSFICSSNNNIARITKMVQALCKHYSPPLLSLSSPVHDSDGTSENVTYYPFPSPSALAASEVAVKLRALGFGYRANFIQRTAKMLVDEHGSATTDLGTLYSIETPEKWLMSLRGFDTMKAREELLRFIGVGRKVADCILLMSLDKEEVIPVDTHVHQIAVKHYGFQSGGSKKVVMTPRLYEKINTKLADTWGEYAGWAHTVLFTADLKTFSFYGMPVSSSTSKKTMPSPSTPILLSNKQMRTIVLPDADELPVITLQDQSKIPTDDTSLAERVKKRQRNI